MSMTTNSETSPAAAAWSAPWPPRAEDRAFRRALAAAGLLHALFLVSFWHAEPRVVGDLNGTDDPITVEIVTPGEAGSPGASAARAEPAPARPPEPELKPTEPAEPAPPQTPPPPAEAVAAEPPAPTPPVDKPAAAQAIQSLSETPDLFTLPDPSRAKTDASQAARQPGHQKPSDQPKDQARKPAVKTSRLDLSLPNTFATEEGAAGGFSAASTRPPNITRSPQNDEFGRRVIAALRVTMPPPLGPPNRVTIRILLSDKGNVVDVHVIRRSDDASLDQSVVYAALQASYPIPPGGSTAIDRTFLVTYIYH